MTQHLRMEDTREDIRTFKHLGMFISVFAAFAVVLALGVTIFAP